MFGAQRAISTLLLLAFGFFSTVGPHWHFHTGQEHSCQSHPSHSEQASSPSSCCESLGANEVGCSTSITTKTDGLESRVEPNELGHSDCQAWASPGHDPNCSICRFYAASVNTTTVFEFDFEFQAEPLTDTVFSQRSSLPLLVYDARGPPTMHL